MIEKIDPKEIDGLFLWDVCKYIYEKYNHLKKHFKLVYKEEEIDLIINFRVAK